MERSGLKLILKLKKKNSLTGRLYSEKHTRVTANQVWPNQEFLFWLCPIKLSIQRKHKCTFIWCCYHFNTPFCVILQYPNEYKQHVVCCSLQFNLIFPVLKESCKDEYFAHLALLLLQGFASLSFRLKIICLIRISLKVSSVFLSFKEIR